MQPISFKRHRFPPDVIRQAVWLYFRFTLSFRDVEEVLAQRGIDVSNETVRCWSLKFGRTLPSNSPLHVVTMARCESRRCDGPIVLFETLREETR